MADTKTAPVADPAPLGLMGFATTTFVLSLVNAGVIDKGGDANVVIGLAAFYGGLAQLLAGMWEFRNGNTFGGVAFSSYGAFWLSFVAFFIPGFGTNFGSANGPSTTALGYYAVAWAIVTGMLLLGTLRLNGGLVAVFLLLFITYIFLAAGFFAKAPFGSGATAIGGWLGVLTAIAAWYVALALVLRSVSSGKIALPIFPLS